MKIDLSGFDDSSKVWIYQSNRPLSNTEALEVQSALDSFANQWVAHNRQLKAKAQLIDNQFVVLAVDETLAGATGCSIDASVHFLKNLQSQLGIDLFDRMRFAYQDGNQISTLDRTAFSKAYEQGDITDETIVVDTLVKTKAELSNILKPLKDSWHRRMV